MAAKVVPSQVATWDGVRTGQRSSHLPWELWPESTTKTTIPKHQHAIHPEAKSQGDDGKGSPIQWVTRSQAAGTVMVRPQPNPLADWGEGRAPSTMDMVLSVADRIRTCIVQKLALDFTYFCTPVNVDSLWAWRS